MSVLNVAANNAAIAWGGAWTDTLINTLWARQLLGTTTTIDFSATGTACTLAVNLVATGQTIQVSVDGGAFTSLSLPGSANVWTDVVLFTGLADNLHTVVVKITAGIVANVAYAFDVMLKITGASPAVSATNAGPIYQVSGVNFHRYGHIHGGFYQGNGSGYVFPPYYLNGGYPDGSRTIKANPTAIRVWSNHSGQHYRVAIDGSVASTSKIAIASDSAWGWTTLASGLDGNAHEYQILDVDAAGSNVLYAIQFIGATSVSAPSQKGLMVGYGDSIMAGSSFSDTSVCILWPIAVAKGYWAYNRGISGTRVLALPGGTSDVLSRVQDAGRLMPPGSVPDVILILIGVNDYSQASYSDAVFRRGYDELLANLQPFYAQGTLVYCCGVLNVASSQTNAFANRTSGNTQISNAVTATGSSNVIYVNTDGWINGSTDTSDGLHPTTAGALKVVTQLLSVIPTFVPPVAGAAGGSII